MNSVKEGDKVQLVCELKLEDGTICFKNKKDKPLVFIVGEGKFFPAIEKELINMKEGETKTVTLKPNEAFGVYKENLVAEIHKKSISSTAELDIGSSIQMKTESDKIIGGKITDIKDDTITVDFNHPLANKNITVTVTMVSIEKN
jgi:FKBP-type peptidyl-prolyl cis-trans isomerase 2